MHSLNIIWDQRAKNEKKKFRLTFSVSKVTHAFIHSAAIVFVSFCNYKYLS